MNLFGASGPSGPMDVLARFGVGAIGLILVTTLVFGLVGGAEEPADATAAPTPSPSVLVSSPAPTASEPAPTETPSPSAEPSETVGTDDPEPAGDIDPATISIQVLDAVLDDSGDTMTNVAAELRDRGYNVVAENRARRTYDQTTVFFTGDFRAQAEQVAAEIGASVVEASPANLSDSVQVHVVVGFDLAEG